MERSPAAAKKALGVACDSNPIGATRRTVIVSLPSLTIALAALRPALALQQPTRRAASAPGFFTDLERAFVTAAVDRLLPADEHGPGGVAAEVSRFIDRHSPARGGAVTTATYQAR